VSPIVARQPAECFAPRDIQTSSGIPHCLSSGVHLSPASNIKSCTMDLQCETTSRTGVTLPSHIALWIPTRRRSTASRKCIYLYIQFAKLIEISTTTHFAAPEWNNVASSHDTLPETASDAADLMQVLIKKNLVRYLSPIDDPVFSAHTKYTQRLDLVNEGNQTTYLSDSAHAVISCRQQVLHPRAYPGHVLTIDSISFATRENRGLITAQRWLAFQGRLDQKNSLKQLNFS